MASFMILSISLGVLRPFDSKVIWVPRYPSLRSSLGLAWGTVPNTSPNIGAERRIQPVTQVSYFSY